jgi:hypothetical protein
MGATFIGIKILKDIELKQSNYGKYSCTKKNCTGGVWTQGLVIVCSQPQKWHIFSMGLAYNPIANVHHHSHTVMVLQNSMYDYSSRIQTKLVLKKILTNL